jgi:outer membrane protein assembly factor BamB
MRSNWWSRRCCQVAAVDGGIVATLGGVTLGMSPGGDVNWIRKHLTVPADDDPRWILQMYERPLISERHAFVVQPGVRAVECLDVKTGGSRWQAVLPEVIGIIGRISDVVVIQTESDLRGLDASSGATRWRYPVLDLLGFPLCSQSSVVLATNEATNGSEERRVRLTWLNAADGNLVESSIVEGLADVDPRLGPIVSVGEKMFTFFGRGQNDLTRDVVELRPIPRQSAQSREASGGN